MQLEASASWGCSVPRWALSISNNWAVRTSSSFCPLFERLSWRRCTDSAHLFLGSPGRCPWGWLPALTVTPSDGSHHCPVPPLSQGVQSSQATCSSRLAVQVRPFRDTTPRKTWFRPVNVAAASQVELREEGTRGLRVFHYQHCTANIHILKYVYVP